MHIVEGFLPPEHAAAWWIASTPMVIAGAAALRARLKDAPDARLVISAAGAFMFGVSALKLPSLTGSCSHPTGVGLGALVCGPPVMAVLGALGEGRGQPLPIALAWEPGHSGSKARQRRMEYPGALYHVPAWGDRKEAVVSAYGDGEALLRTVGEMRERTAIRFHTKERLNSAVEPHEPQHREYWTFHPPSPTRAAIGSHHRRPRAVNRKPRIRARITGGSCTLTGHSADSGPNSRKVQKVMPDPSCP